jgi:hypothetical protein
MKVAPVCKKPQVSRPETDEGRQRTAQRRAVSDIVTTKFGMNKKVCTP